MDQAFPEFNTPAPFGVADWSMSHELAREQR